MKRIFATSKGRDIHPFARYRYPHLPHIPRSTAILLRDNLAKSIYRRFLSFSFLPSPAALFTTDTRSKRATLKKASFGSQNTSITFNGKISPHSHIYRKFQVLRHPLRIESVRNEESISFDRLASVDVDCSIVNVFGKHNAEPSLVEIWNDLLTPRSLICSLKLFAKVSTSRNKNLPFLIIARRLKKVNLNPNQQKYVIASSLKYRFQLN